MKKIKLSKKNKRNTYKLLAIYNLNSYDIEYILYDKLMQLIYQYIKKLKRSMIYIRHIFIKKLMKLFVKNIFKNIKV